MPRCIMHTITITSINTITNINTITSITTISTTTTTIITEIAFSPNKVKEGWKY